MENRTTPYILQKDGKYFVFPSESAACEYLERQCKEVFRIDAVSPDDYWITRNEAYNEALWKSWVESFGDYLKTRPTIIEAEEET